MKRFILTAAACAIVAGCASDPAPRPTAPRAPSGEAPGPDRPATVSAQDAAAICKVTASTKFGVRLPDVIVGDTKKVDAGWLSKLTIGNVEKNCVVTPDGSIRSLQ